LESRSSGNKKAVPVPKSSTAIKRTTANSNNVSVTRTTAAPAPKAKKSKEADPAIEMQDDDNLQEEEAALASPIKGSESRKISKALVFHLILSDPMYTN
jgi:hypothetical protein